MNTMRSGAGGFSYFNHLYNYLIPCGVGQVGFLTSIIYTTIWYEYHAEWGRWVFLLQSFIQLFDIQLFDMNTMRSGAGGFSYFNHLYNYLIWIPCGVGQVGFLTSIIYTTIWYEYHAEWGRWVFLLQSFIQLFDMNTMRSGAGGFSYFNHLYNYLIWIPCGVGQVGFLTSIIYTTIWYEYHAEWGRWVFLLQSFIQLYEYHAEWGRWVFLLQSFIQLFDMNTMRSGAGGFSYFNHLYNYLIWIPCGVGQVGFLTSIIYTTIWYEYHAEWGRWVFLLQSFIQLFDMNTMRSGAGGFSYFNHLYNYLIWIPCGVGQVGFLTNHLYNYLIWIPCRVGQVGFLTSIIYTTIWYEYHAQSGAGGFSYFNHLYNYLIWIPCGVGQAGFLTSIIYTTIWYEYHAEWGRWVFLLQSFIQLFDMNTMQSGAGGFSYFNHLYNYLIWIPCGVGQVGFLTSIIYTTIWYEYHAEWGRWVFLLQSFIQLFDMNTMRSGAGGFSYFNQNDLYNYLIWIPCGVGQVGFLTSIIYTTIWYEYHVEWGRRVFLLQSFIQLFDMNTMRSGAGGFSYFNHLYNYLIWIPCGVGHSGFSYFNHLYNYLIWIPCRVGQVGFLTSIIYTTIWYEYHAHVQSGAGGFSYFNHLYNYLIWIPCRVGQVGFLTSIIYTTIWYECPCRVGAGGFSYFNHLYNYLIWILMWSGAGRVFLLQSFIQLFDMNTMRSGSRWVFLLTS